MAFPASLLKTICGFAVALALTTIGIVHPAAASDPQAVDTARFHIGDTGIRCIKDPCPRRAVFNPDAEGNVDMANLLYVDLDGRKDPPPLETNDEMRAAIVAAWNDHGCIAVDGRLIGGPEDRPILRVDRIVGECRAATADGSPVAR